MKDAFVGATPEAGMVSGYFCNNHGEKQYTFLGVSMGKESR